MYKIDAICCTASVLFWGGKRETRKTIGIYVRQTIRRCVDGTSDHQFFSESRNPGQSLGKLNFVENQPFPNYEPCCGSAKTIPRKLAVSTSILGFYDRRLRKNTWLSDRQMYEHSVFHRVSFFTAIVWMRYDRYEPSRSYAVSDKPCFSR